MKKEPVLFYNQEIESEINSVLLTLSREERLDLDINIKILSYFLKNFSEVIPKDHVIGGGGEKVRSAWFQGAIDAVDFVLNRVIQHDNLLKREFNDFVQIFRQRRRNAVNAFKRGEVKDTFVLTTREEIDSMNTFLERALQYLRDIQTSASCPKK